ncbi:MAG: hypothetical protein U9R74_07595 [Pseudomonadota bacterium]|nr:hypothetical protein [Pseudomonadota bacterium]
MSASSKGRVQLRVAYGAEDLEANPGDAFYISAGGQIFKVTLQGRVSLRVELGIWS